jgi:SAM-dependent methyltransferase
MHEWIDPKMGEVSVDIAAGTGFLTEYVYRWTRERVYAIDPSGVQLDAIKKKCSDLPIITIEGSLSEEKTFQKLGEDIGAIDFVTSFGGIHHVIDANGENKQKMMFENISRMLKPGGRLVAADVGEGTKLSEHFEKSVKNHCLTGHHEKWLNVNRLKNELIRGTGLNYIKSDIIPIQWIFNSKQEMVLFMKALHAYDMTEQQVLEDLSSILGFEEKNDGVYLNWPMLFFHLQKE